MGWGGVGGVGRGEKRGEGSGHCRWKMTEEKVAEGGRALGACNLLCFLLLEGEWVWVGEGE